MPVPRAIPVQAHAPVLNECPKGPFGDEGVDVPVTPSPLAAPLEAEPREVEPLAQVHHLGLGRGQPQQTCLRSLDIRFTARR